MIADATRPIDLQDAVVYGPIPSRRLGQSLGINLLPLSYKLCSFNCVYCQYGWTTNRNEKGERLLSAQELLAVAREQIQTFKDRATHVDCLTLAGNGEPTLHPQLRLIIEGLIRLRDEFYPNASLGILSDSHSVDRPQVREALELLDHRYMKLDVGTPQMLAALNKPIFATDWQRIIEGLRQLKDTILQSLFVSGSLDNTSAEAINAWIHTVATIRPIEVQVYTVSRPTADPEVRKVCQQRLEEIAEELGRKTGIRACVYD